MANFGVMILKNFPVSDGKTSWGDSTEPLHPILTKKSEAVGTFFAYAIKILDIVLYVRLGNLKIMAEIG